MILCGHRCQHKNLVHQCRPIYLRQLHQYSSRSPVRRRYASCRHVRTNSRYLLYRGCFSSVPSAEVYEYICKACGIVKHCSTITLAAFVVMSLCHLCCLCRITSISSTKQEPTTPPSAFPTIGPDVCLPLIYDVQIAAQGSIAGIESYNFTAFCHTWAADHCARHVCHIVSDGGANCVLL